jgi:hypothetical protein
MKCLIRLINLIAALVHFKFDDGCFKNFYPILKWIKQNGESLKQVIQKGRSCFSKALHTSQFINSPSDYSNYKGYKKIRKRGKIHNSSSELVTGYQ